MQSYESYESWKCLRSYTQVANELRNFCHDLEIDFFGRYLKNEGLKIGSMSEIWESALFRIPLALFSESKFFSSSNSLFAVVKEYVTVNEVNLLEAAQTSIGFIYELSDLSDFKVKPLDNLKYKSVVLSLGDKSLVSVMREGFEHH